MSTITQTKVSTSPRPATGAAQFQSILRRLAIVGGFLVIWQSYIWIGQPNELLVPGPTQVARAFVEGLASGELSLALLGTLKYLGIGFAIGIALATCLTVLSTWSRLCDEMVSVAIATLTPLPAIAIVPLALVWFGVGPTALIFVVSNAVVWPAALNFSAGFRSVDPVLVMVGRTWGLSRLELTRVVVLPAASVHLVTGIRTGWIFAWRTAIGAELIFGSTGGSGGLGVYINNASLFLQVPDVFAGLVSIAVMGLLVEGVFRLIEHRTVIRWGMKGLGT